MDIIGKDAMKEFLKCYLIDICFNISIKIRTNIHILLSIIQILCIVCLLLSKILFKDNYLVLVIISAISCTSVWLCLFITFGTSFIVKKAQEKADIEVENYCKYLDTLVNEDYTDLERINDNENENTETVNDY